MTTIKDRGEKGHRRSRHRAGIAMWLALGLNARDKEQACRRVNENFKLSSICNWMVPFIHSGLPARGKFRFEREKKASVDTSGGHGKRQSHLPNTNSATQSMQQTEFRDPVKRQHPTFCGPMASVLSSSLLLKCGPQTSAFEPLRTLLEMRNLWLPGRTAKLGSVLQQDSKVISMQNKFPEALLQPIVEAQRENVS